MSGMLMLVVVVFVGVFAVLALLLYASGASASEHTKQTLANLESALATNRPDSRDQMVDIRKIELLSAVPWVNRWLLSMELAPRLRTLLLQSNLNWTAGRLLFISVFCFVIPAYLVYLRTGAAIFAVIIGVLTGFAPLMYVLHKRRQRFDKFEQGLPEALDLIVSALRAGHSLIAALRLVAQESPEPIGGEFRTCFEEQNYGLELRTALENLVNRVPLQDMRIVATAILIQKESGGNLAEVLDKAAQLIRDHPHAFARGPWFLALSCQPGNDEFAVEESVRRETARRLGRHDRGGWFGHSEDCEHGSVKVSNGIRSL